LEKNIEMVDMEILRCPDQANIITLDSLLQVKMEKVFLLV